MDEERGGHENSDKRAPCDGTTSNAQARNFPTTIVRKERKGGARRRPREHVGCDVLLSFLEITCKPHTKMCRQHDHLISSPRGVRFFRAESIPRKHSPVDVEVAWCVCPRPISWGLDTAIVARGWVNFKILQPPPESPTSVILLYFFEFLLVAERYGPRACISSDDI